MPEELDELELPERPELLPEEELSSPNDDSSLRFESPELPDVPELLPERDPLPLLLDPLSPSDFPKLLCESEDPDDSDDPLWLAPSLFRSFAIHPPALLGRTDIPRYDAEQCLRCPYEKANSVPARASIDGAQGIVFAFSRCKPGVISLRRPLQY